MFFPPVMALAEHVFLVGNDTNRNVLPTDYGTSQVTVSTARPS
jgi:hypothetical protein